MNSIRCSDFEYDTSEMWTFTFCHENKVYFLLTKAFSVTAFSFCFPKDFYFFFSFFSGDPNAGWGGPNPGQTQLNVVTTIFPVHTTQSGPFTHNTPGFANTTMTGASGHGQPPQGYPSMNKPGYNPQAMAPYK